MKNFLLAIALPLSFLALLVASISTFIRWDTARPAQHIETTAKQVRKTPIEFTRSTCPTIIQAHDVYPDSYDCFPRATLKITGYENDAGAAVPHLEPTGGVHWECRER